MTNPITYHLIAENDLTADHHQCICDLLVLAYPKYEYIFSKSSYYFSLPEYRLWIEDEHSTMIAHLDIERRMIAVNGEDVYVAGIGEVATHPNYQGQGIGHLLMNRLTTILREKIIVDYGFLKCLQTVAGFYRRVGWHSIKQAVHEEDIDTDEIKISQGSAMILPIRKTMDQWQTEGFVDLRGLSW